MTAPNILASIESLAPDAIQGWTELIADLRAWGVNEANATSIRAVDDTVMLDRGTTMADADAALPASRSIVCRFARDSDARHAAQLLRGYQAALKAGE